LIPAGKLEFEERLPSPERVLERALAERPDLLAKRYELQRAEAEIALVKRQVFPNPILGLSFTREGTGDKIVVGGVSIPLPIFNRRQGELDSLAAKKMQARAEVSALEKEIRKEVDQVINQWQAAKRNIELFQREVLEQTNENLRLLEAAYRQRAIDLPRVLIMGSDLVTVRQSYLEALLSFRETSIGLEEISGEVR
jgi:outer membrane protein, heavy metal efflux system